jgi:hypothetical protein
MARLRFADGPAANIAAKSARHFEQAQSRLSRFPLWNF